MSTTNNNPETPLDFEPAPEAPPQIVADEMLAHGLLTYLNKDSEAQQSRRVGRVMEEIGVLTGSVDRSEGRRLRFPIQTARGWMALAASIALVTTAAFFGFPGETSAQAVVEKSIATMKVSGDRRYEVRLAMLEEEQLPAVANAVVDTRPGRMLLRTQAPNGFAVFVGRDATGDWAIRPDGEVEREKPQKAWPRWATVGEESLFADSVDRLLDEMTRTYTLERKPDATMKGHGEIQYRHISGTKKRVRAPGGEHVDIWIDPSTNVVERLEMRWDPPAAGADGPGNRGPDGGPGGSGAPGDRGPTGPRGPRGDRPPRDGFGPGGPRGDEPGDGPRGGAPGGPDGPDDQMDGPGRGPRGGPPDGLRDGSRDGPRGPRGGPDGGPRDRTNDGPMGRLGDGPPGQGGPDGSGGGPRGERRPPRLLLMQRVDVPGFEDGWFGPDVHQKK